MGGPDSKISTVDVESGDNMATLPVSRAHTSSTDTAEKNNAANKEMELKNVMPKPLERTSLFIITSLVYAMLLIVMCVAYVISDVSTHRLPIVYYEGFFTYLYGASILFLLYVFCFLLQESSCCNGGSNPKPPKPVKEKKEKPKKEKKEKPKKEKGAAGEGTAAEAKEKDSKSSGKEKKDEKAKPVPFQEAPAAPEPEVQVATPKNVRRRKTTHNDPSYGSFFLRVGAIAFGLGTLIYVGLELGSFFEIPFTSPCHQILRGVNPLLQMIFTFMQMYFIFMNARLNIHRFKVLARFGLMHICATNICVWIRTLVLESLKEITFYFQKRQGVTEDGVLIDSIRSHTLQHAGTVLGTHSGPHPEWEPIDLRVRDEANENLLSKALNSTARAASKALYRSASYMPGDATTQATPSATSEDLDSTTMIRKLKKFVSTTVATTISSTLPSTTTTTTTSTTTTTTAPTTTPPPSPSTSTLSQITESSSFASSTVQAIVTDAVTTPSTPASLFSNPLSGLENAFQTMSGLSHNETQLESLDSLFPQALIASSAPGTNLSCGRVNIMGTIVQDSAPYLYPFIIEYSLIGAVVIYVMWKHIGRYAKGNEEDLEHRLEVMLSRRAVAMAQRARSGRVDCVGASKGLFFGLLALVASLICLILFFVLVVKKEFNRLAIFLADCSHGAILSLSILAILIGFCRVSKLKFRCEETGNLNDILLRISAFGVFIYSAFSIIAGALNLYPLHEPSLLVTVTSSVVVLQVVLQLLFIADVSRRRVHLPEHDRTKPGRQVVTFLLIANVAMFAIYTFEAQKVANNPVQLNFYGYIGWALIQRVTLPLCIFHRFHSAVTLAEIWKTTYKARLE